jgi:hypothetical protein
MATEEAPEMAAADSFAHILKVSRRVNWSIEDVVEQSFAFDYGRCFLPESLAAAELPFLSVPEQRALNQIRAHGYLCLFRLAEEFILPFVLDYARDNRADNDTETQALLHFAEEEVKHIQLFRLFRDEFARGFGTACHVIGPPQTMARSVLEHSELGVALSVFHIEWMTQRHFVESARDERVLDEHFRSLLKYHWLEEAQHTKLDELMIRNVIQRLDAEEIALGVEDYVRIVTLLDGGLRDQVWLDLDALQRACGRQLNDSEQSSFIRAQTCALRRTFLVSGMTHPKFLEIIELLSPQARVNIERMARGFEASP